MTSMLGHLPDELRCIRIKSNGERCLNPRVKGTTLCRSHGGTSRHIRQAGARRHKLDKAKAAALAYASKMIADEGLIDIDPAAKLVDSLIQWDALARYWGELCAKLDVASAERIGQGLRGELQYSKPTDELDLLAVGTNDNLLGFNRHGEAAIHPFVLEYKDALKERAKVAKLCLDAGIAERRVRLAEGQGKMIATLIRDLVAEIEKMTGQVISSRPEFPATVRRLLLQVSSDTALPVG